MDFPEEFPPIDNDPTVWLARVAKFYNFGFNKMSGTAKFRCLLDCNVFVLVPIYDADGYLVYDSRFVNQVKVIGTPEDQAKL